MLLCTRYITAFLTFLIFRTGRFGKPGIAINLVDSDTSMNVVKKFEEYFGCFLNVVLFFKRGIFIGRTIELLDSEDYEQLEAIERETEEVW